MMLFEIFILFCVALIETADAHCKCKEVELKQGLVCTNADLLDVIGSICQDEVTILIWNGEPCPLGPLLTVWKRCWIDAT